MATHRYDVVLNYAGGVLTIFALATILVAKALMNAPHLLYLLSVASLFLIGLIMVVVVLGSSDAPRRLYLFPVMSSLSTRHRILYLAGLVCLAESAALFSILMVLLFRYMKQAQ
jgi:hypothetical protein